MTSYWHQRDITNRLIAARQERQAAQAEPDECEDLELPQCIIDAINAFYCANGLITQTPITDEYY